MILCSPEKPKMLQLDADAQKIFATEMNSIKLFYRVGI